MLVSKDIFATNYLNKKQLLSIMATSFEIEVPMKDHPVVIMVTPRENTRATFDLTYCDEPCGCMFSNEHGIWIYEPHAHAGLLLNAEQIQHLGKAITQHKW